MIYHRMFSQMLQGLQGIKYDAILSEFFKSVYYHVSLQASVHDKQRIALYTTFFFPETKVLV
jgi:hypothetical protein